MYEAMDLLHANIEEVEKTLFFNTASLFNLEDLRTTKVGQLRINRGAVADAAKYDGKWVIETNDDTISLEDAACVYKSLMVIERCFRSL